MNPTIRLPLAFISLGILTSISASAQNPKPTSESSKNSVSTNTNNTSEYEIRGIFGKGDKLQVSIAKIGKTRSTWLKVGQKSGPLLVEEIDTQKGTGVISVNGVRSKIKMAKVSEQDSKQDSKSVDTSTFDYNEERDQKRLLQLYNSLNQASDKVLFPYLKALTPDQRELWLKLNFSDAYQERFSQGGVSPYNFHLEEILQQVAALPDKSGKVSALPQEMIYVAKLQTEYWRYEKSRILKNDPDAFLRQGEKARIFNPNKHE